jgi:hypothetical protein
MDNSTPSHPERGLYLHQYGGLYEVLGVAEHTEDKSSEPLVIYKHLWPFTPGDLKARPLSQWEGRFRAISEETLDAAMRDDRQAAQDAVTHAKTHGLKFGESGQTYSTYR